jgi:hypothetical protein
MLLFKPEHVKPVDSGLKTETRRIWKKKRCKVGSIHKAKTKMLSKNYFALLKIKAVWKEEFHCITEEGARKEGGYTRDAFIDKFFEINPKIAELTGEGAVPFNVWVIDFEKVGVGNLPIDSKEFA